MYDKPSVRGLDNTWILSPASSVTSDNFEQESKLNGLQDSVSRKRRHAVYFHRPPVWHYSSYQDEGSSTSRSSSSPDGASERNLSFFSVDLAEQKKSCPEPTDMGPAFASYDFDSDQETPLLENTALHSQLTLPDCQGSCKETGQDSFHQTKPVFCTRLQSYKDIRLGLGEQCAIQEGSLVIGLDPEYTLLDECERQQDEFEVFGGDVYIVCRLYADLWALCVRPSFDRLPDESGPKQLAFLPLCAVTLAANFSAFIRRSTRYARYSSSKEFRHPGNGLPVMPPRRSHSINASKQLFQSHKAHVSLPFIVHDVYQSISLKQTDAEFVPLDSTLEPILSKLTSRRQRWLRGVGTSGSLSRFSIAGWQPVTWKVNHTLKSSSLLSICQKGRPGSSRDGWRHLRRERQSSSGASQAFKWLSKSC